MFLDPCFALKLVENLTANFFDPPLFAAYCSPNLNVALERIRQFKPLIGPMRLHLTQSARKTELVLEYLEMSLDVPVSLIASELAFFVQLARMATRAPVKPLKVSTPKSLPQLERYSRYFGVKISWRLDCLPLPIRASGLNAGSRAPSLRNRSTK